MKVNRFMLKVALGYMAKNDARIHKGLPLPDAEHSRLDIKPFPEALYPQQYDIYYASNPNGITIIDIHGGAYIYSTRKNNAYLAKYFIDKGFNFVTLDYRLNRGTLDPHDQVRDLATELKHLFEHAEEYGLNPAKMVLTGDSAGGHFALILAEMMRDPSIAQKIDADLGKAVVKGVAVNSPVYRFVEIGMGDSLSKTGKRYMVGPRCLDAEYISLVCPRAHFSALRYPLFISSCKNDFLRDESLALVEDLKQANLPFTFKDIMSDEPGIVHVHNVMRPYLEESKVVNDAMADFFQGCFEN